jgi:hypothetical protein
LHWIAPEIRYGKPARLRRLATGSPWSRRSTRFPTAAIPFWAEVRDDDDAVPPSDDNRPPPRPEAVGDLRDDVVASGVFEAPVVRRHLFSCR